MNASADDKGWFLKMKIADASELESLMDAAAYKTYCDGLWWMWDLLASVGILALAVLLCGAAICYFLLTSVIGPEGSIIVGLLLSAYPAYLVFRKFEM